MRVINIFEQSSQYTIYVDLDGVLADLTSYVEDMLGRQVQTRPDGCWENDTHIWKEVEEGGGIEFDKLSMLPDANKLWGYVKKYTPHILTATGQPVEKNADLKRKWVRSNLTGYGQVLTVEKSHLKSEYASPTSILIDDRTKSIHPWERAGGIGIHHKSAEDTIKALKQLGL